MIRSNPIFDALGDLLEKFEVFKGTTDVKTYWLGILSIILVEVLFLVVFAAFGLVFYVMKYIGDISIAAVASNAIWYRYFYYWFIKIIFTWIPGIFLGVSGALVVGFPITMILPAVTMAIRRTRDVVGTGLVYVALMAIIFMSGIFGAQFAGTKELVAIAVGGVSSLAVLVMLVLPGKK